MLKAIGFIKLSSTDKDASNLDGDQVYGARACTLAQNIHIYFLPIISYLFSITLQDSSTQSSYELKVQGSWGFLCSYAANCKYIQWIGGIHLTSKFSIITKWLTFHLLHMECLPSCTS